MAADLVIVCLPAVGGIAIDPCGSTSGVAYAPAVVTRPQISDAQVAFLDILGGPVDVLQSAGFFGFAAATVVSLWFLAWAIARVVESVRSI